MSALRFIIDDKDRKECFLGIIKGICCHNPSSFAALVVPVEYELLKRELLRLLSERAGL